MRPRSLAWVAAALLTIVIRPAAAEMPPEHVIVVSGDGSVNAAPDLATVSAGVTSRGKTAREASEATNKAMERVLAALREGGILERDVRTDYLSLQPVHEDVRNGNGLRITGFQASNAVTITVREIAKLGTVLDRVIAAGANEISGISFEISDRSTRLDEARVRAVEDARRKAEILAKAAGVGLGRPTKIVEESHSPPGPIMMRAAAAPSTPIAAGEQTLRVGVSVSYELM